MSRQLIVVTTPSWDTIGGTLYRFTRGDVTDPWKPVGAPVAVVVGRTGLAWGASLFDPAGQRGPMKHEGDGRSPAGVFHLGTAFGFGPVDSIGLLNIPYRQLTSATDCVDDTTSRYYSMLVDSNAVSRVDWTSSEHMRQIDPDYRVGVFVNYNTTPRVPGQGSCIFIHVWEGPASPTAGCTALDQTRLLAVMHWLDTRAVPVLVQLPQAEYDRLRAAWAMPPLPPMS